MGVVQQSRRHCRGRPYHGMMRKKHIGWCQRQKEPYTATRDSSRHGSLVLGLCKRFYRQVFWRRWTNPTNIVSKINESMRNWILQKRTSSLSVSSSSSASLEGGDISGSVSSTLLTHLIHLALSGSLR